MSLTGTRLAALVVALTGLPNSAQVACHRETPGADDGEDVSRPTDLHPDGVPPDPAPRGPDADEPLDASDGAPWPPDTAAPDTSAPETTAPDTSTAPTALRVGHHDLLETGLGPVEGELIAIHDHRRWWKSPSDEETLALFSADRFAPWPDDRSILFLERSRVLRQVESPPPAEPCSSWRFILPTGLTTGDWVEAGEPLGRIGNSGTSLEPHLHLVLLYWDHERARYWSVPVDSLDVHAATRPTGSEPRARFAPLGGAWVGNAPF